MSNMDIKYQIGTYYNNNQDLVTGLFSCGFLEENEKITLLTKLLGNLQGKSVLDLGCGKGGFVPLIEKMGCNNYLGIDLSTKALNIAKKKYPKYNFLHGDIHNATPKLKKTKWDIVLVCDVLEHSYNQNKLISNVNLLLKHKGFLLIVIPNYFNFMGVRKKIKEIRHYKTNTWAPFCNERPQLHENFTTSFQIRKLLQKNGFEITKQYGWDLLTALSFTSPYAENGLKGFWGRNGYQYGKLNRLFLNKMSSISAPLSMYYIVSAQKINNNDRITN
jgi:2-polyprenyl-3-methyl-5-hydroxy-6-metoxy-1,4-benzoquinol methylase